MSARVVVLERTELFSPFGVVFQDFATRTHVRGGLEVVHRPGPAAPPVYAEANPSGVFVLGGLPGLGTLERGTAGDGPAPAGRCRIEVSDPDGRFLPVAFDADLPTPPGLFDPGCGVRGSPPWAPASPPGSAEPPAVPLFSTASRPLPPGMAVLRAQLTTVGGEPAAWAVLELSDRGRPVGLGVADGNGLASVVFAYPEPASLPLSPVGGSSRLSDQVWTLDLHAYFGGGSPASEAPIAAGSTRPDLCDLLDQRPAALLADASGTPLSTVQLRYGRELVVRTSPGSTLLLVPSGSPPSP